MHRYYAEPPDFTENETKNILKNFFDMDASVRNLNSDIGQNFYIKDEKGAEFIFKISNPSETLDMLDAQNKAMDFVKQAGLNFELPAVIQTRDGGKILEIQKGNKTYNARLLTFISGEFLAEIQPQTPELLLQLGEMLGALDKRLSEFSHPAVQRYWHWDLKNALDSRPLIKHIDQPEKRRLAEYFLLQFETEVLAKVPELHKSLIQNDANDYNILVDSGQNRIKGIIDFGDMVYSCTVFEPAAALAYAMFDKDDPIQAAAEIVRGYNKEYPLTELEIDVLFYSASARLCLTVIMAAYQRSIQPDNEYVSISEKQAWQLLEKLLRTNPQRARLEFRKACGMEADSVKGLLPETIVDERRKRLGKSLSISYKKPLKIIRGAMQYLFDEDGSTYLDCVNNVCHVGHCHPHVVRAVREQMPVLNTNTRFLHDNLVNYARRLADTFPDPLNVCFFVNSGSEANELAIRLARTHTNDKELIILDHAYHGNTSLLVDISPYKYNGAGGKGPGPFTHKAVMPDLYRGPYREDDTQAVKKYAGHVEEIINELSAENKTASFMGESLLGCGGQIVLPEGYLKEVYKLVRQAGGVCIADEVQVGFGRVGEKFWAFELQDVVPDIVSLGKPIGNGHPLAAVVTTEEIADSFNNGMEFFNTFGGNPVSCAAGLAVLDVIENENLQANALKAGNHLLEGLKGLQEKYKIIGDVRGKGLFVGVELVKDRENRQPAAQEASLIIEKMKDRGILISTDGPDNNVLKLKPPIVFDMKNAEQVVNELDSVLKENGF